MRERQVCGMKDEIGGFDRRSMGVGIVTDSGCYIYVRTQTHMPARLRGLSCILVYNSRVVKLKQEDDTWNVAIYKNSSGCAMQVAWKQKTIVSNAFVLPAGLCAKHSTWFNFCSSHNYPGSIHIPVLQSRITRWEKANYLWVEPRCRSSVPDHRAHLPNHYATVSSRRRGGVQVRTRAREVIFRWIQGSLRFQEELERLNPRGTALPAARAAPLASMCM